MNTLVQHILPCAYRKQLLLAGCILSLLSSCSQYGCPGGMCAPDHYYSSPKKTFRKTLTARTNKARHVNYGKYNRQLQHQAKYKANKVEAFSKKYNNKWSTYYSKSSFNSDIEAGSFKTPRTKKPDNSALFKAKAYKEPKRRKKNYGLWPPEIRNYQSKLPDKKTKVDDTAKKKGKGVKKIK